MTIASASSRNNYIGNGSVATYSYTFKVFSYSDLLVTTADLSDVETTLVFNTDFSATGLGEDGGGTITLAANLANGFKLTIRRVVDVIQETDIKNLGAFYPETHEDQFDKLVMIDQQQEDAIDRSITFAETVDPSDFDTTLPAALVGEANVTIITNATGDGFEVGPSAAAISAASSNASAAAADAAAAAASEAAAAASEIAAAASAAAALAAANSQLWNDVVFVTVADSPITLNQAANGKLYSVDTSGGNVVINLPQISTLTLPYNVGVKKSDSSGNSITINRAGTDTIDGATSKVLAVSSSGAVLIADTDPSPDLWSSAEFGASGGNLVVDSFSGDASTTVFTTSVAAGSVNNAQIFISGVYQNKSTYTIVGTTLTFSAAPPTGTNNIQVVIGTTLSIGTPSDGTVTLAKLSAAVIENLVPTGTILPFAGFSGVVPNGFLACDGATVSRTTFLSLYTVIGDQYGSGNGSTTFHVPDFRGRFLRGTDGGTGRDPDAASRTAMNAGGNTGINVGSIQAGAVEAHTHDVDFYNGGLSTQLFNGGTDGAVVRGTISSASTGGNETRPINAYVNYIIKT
jgi:microcystin-dependent protein